jgi:hypothetical protein
MGASEIRPASNSFSDSRTAKTPCTVAARRHMIRTVDHSFTAIFPRDFYMS